jgi:arsenate reductase
MRDTSGKIYNVLFLCTGNSARSILAEAIANRDMASRFRGYSAGSFPKGEVNPHAITLLKKMKYPTDGLRSKNWEEFAVEGAPSMDFVFTVCDNAAGEMCPIWPGQPIRAHWGITDPATVEGTQAEIERAFKDAFWQMHRRITLFGSLRLHEMDRFRLEKTAQSIGAMDGATADALTKAQGAEEALQDRID